MRLTLGKKVVDHRLCVSGGQSWREPRERGGERNMERDFPERGNGRFDDYHRVPSFERTPFGRTHSSGLSCTYYKELGGVYVRSQTLMLFANVRQLI